MIIRFTVFLMVCCLSFPVLAQDEETPETEAPAAESTESEPSVDTSDAEKGAQDLKNNTNEVDNSINAIESTIEAQKKALGIPEEKAAVEKEAAANHDHGATELSLIHI